MSLRWAHIPFVGFVMKWSIYLDSTLSYSSASFTAVPIGESALLLVTEPCTAVCEMMLDMESLDETEGWCIDFEWLVLFLLEDDAEKPWLSTPDLSFPELVFLDIFPLSSNRS